ncbi:hypothetical protein BDV93DRAFT_556312 [Ceratobasidium sp. AG-I]|nr:hypothetical protein BDV93DRAFT_556312 [Ceratobasidium sp. AG-I]
MRDPSVSDNEQEDNVRALLEALQNLMKQRDEARSHNDTAAVHSIEIKIAATMRSLGDAYPDEESKREWREKADAYEQGNDVEKEHILMPLAKGLGILIATPFAVAGGAIFAAGAIVYGAGKTVEGLGNTLTGGAFHFLFSPCSPF